MLEDVVLFRDVLGPASVKLGVALACGLILGLEREIKEKPAGLRTLILITVGATLFMIVSDLVAVVTRGSDDITRVDPSRIASHVVSGVGFLGGGAIIQSRATIRGLTTAADIWVAAGIGLIIGLGFPLLGIGITMLVLLVLVVLDPIRARLGRTGDHHEIGILIPNDMLVLELVTNTLRSNDVPKQQIRIGRSEDGLVVDVTYHARESGQRHLLDELTTIEGVRGARVDV